MKWSQINDSTIPDGHGLDTRHDLMAVVIAVVFGVALCGILKYGPVADWKRSFNDALTKECNEKFPGSNSRIADGVPGRYCIVDAPERWSGIKQIGHL